MGEVRPALEKSEPKTLQRENRRNYLSANYSDHAEKVFEVSLWCGRKVHQEGEGSQRGAYREQ
jgi:hypothetical protein